MIRHHKMGDPVVGSREQENYSSWNSFLATRKFNFRFCYCNAATLIGGLKTIGLEGDNNVEIDY